MGSEALPSSGEGEGKDLPQQSRTAPAELQSSTPPTTTSLPSAEPLGSTEVVCHSLTTLANHTFP